MSDILHTITGEIRGGGIGDDAWVAQITGPDAKFGLKRAFLRKSGHTSRSGRSGTLIFTITEPGFYEVRGLQLDASQASIGTLLNAFYRIDGEGAVTVVSKAEVVAAFSGGAA